MTAEAVNLWSNAEHAREYLDRRAADSWRAAAYGHLLEIVPVPWMWCGATQQMASIAQFLVR